MNDLSKRGRGLESPARISITEEGRTGYSTSWEYGYNMSERLDYNDDTSSSSTVTSAASSGMVVSPSHHYSFTQHYVLSFLLRFLVLFFFLFCSIINSAKERDESSSKGGIRCDHNRRRSNGIIPLIPTK